MADLPVPFLEGGSSGQDIVLRFYRAIILVSIALIVLSVMRLVSALATSPGHAPGLSLLGRPDGLVVEHKLQVGVLGLQPQPRHDQLQDREDVLASPRRESADGTEQLDLVRVEVVDGGHRIVSLRTVISLVGEGSFGAG